MQRQLIERQKIRLLKQAIQYIDRIQEIQSFIDSEMRKKDKLAA
ncbi:MULTISPECIES: hypothetical protein [unclassified Serratia (in: enterobacteria)]